MRLAFCIAVVWLLLPQPHFAHAQTPRLLLLTPKVEAGTARGVEGQVMTALVDELEARSFEVDFAHNYDSRLPDNLRACNAAECAVEVKHALAMDAVVAVNLFHMDAGASLSVAFVDASDQTYTGHAEIDATQSVADAATHALRQALDAQQRGPGPWLIVRGEPAGAQVRLNDKPIGTLPKAMVVATPGPNRIVVHADGYLDFSDTRSVSEDIDASVEVEVALQRGSNVSSTTGASTPASISAAPHGTRRASAADYAVGGTLALGGVLLMAIDPIRTLVSAGDCANASCSKVYGFSSQIGWELLGGAAMIGTGLAVALWWKPFGTELHVTPLSMRLTRHF